MDLAHDALFHTNGRLGMLFAQTEIMVYELKDLSGSVEGCEAVGGVAGCVPIITPPAPPPGP